MSGPMYFKPTPEEVAAAKASTCHMATPKDPRDCIGSHCMYWDATKNAPCGGYRGGVMTVWGWIGNPPHTS